MTTRRCNQCWKKKRFPQDFVSLKKNRKVNSNNCTQCCENRRQRKTGVTVISRNDLKLLVQARDRPINPTGTRFDRACRLDDLGLLESTRHGFSLTAQGATSLVVLQEEAKSITAQQPVRNKIMKAMEATS